jgi:hypothetical protein
VEVARGERRQQRVAHVLPVEPHQGEAQHLDARRRLVVVREGEERDGCHQRVVVAADDRERALATEAAVPLRAHHLDLAQVLGQRRPHRGQLVAPLRRLEHALVVVPATQTQASRVRGRGGGVPSIVSTSSTSRTSRAGGTLAHVESARR